MDQRKLESSRPDQCGQLACWLLAWFEDHARNLPWRRHRDPYAIWVSEVMLQQTRVETVIPYYERFLERFPNVKALADAPLEDVLKLWEGLGYYARARRLHQAAQVLAKRNEGHLPRAFDELQQLPGVGPYTAGAIASLAFGAAVPAVDGNARRVLARLFAIREDVVLPGTKQKLREIAADLLPRTQPGRFNEALIELGALVCTPRSPTCARCPLRALCRAYAQGVQEELPVRRPRRRVPHYEVTAAVTVREDGAVLVAQRHLDDMLGGLWEFPGGRCEDGETLPECLMREMREELGVAVEVGDRLTVVDHAYTHFRITLYAFWCRLVGRQPRCVDCAKVRWVVLEGLDELPMSVADRKIAKVVGAVAARRGLPEWPVVVAEEATGSGTGDAGN